MPENIDMINIAADFSPYPAGRDEQDGPDNGSKFRDSILAVRLKDAIRVQGKLKVSLDGVRSFGSSFLEEAFGGLVRRAGFQKADVKAHLEIVSSSSASSRYIDAIWRYIEKAKA